MRIVKDVSGRKIQTSEVLSLPIVPTLPILEKNGAMIFDAVTQTPKYFKFDEGTGTGSWIDFSGSGSGVLPNLSSSGPGTSLVLAGASPNFQISNLSEGENISLSPSGSGALEITSVVTTPTILSSVGTGTSLLVPGQTYQMRSISGVNGISIDSSDPNVLVINFTPPGGAPPAVTLASVGTGTSMVFNGTGPNLQIKKFIGAGGVSIDETDPTVLIFSANTADYSALNLASIGTGSSLVSNGTPPSFTTRGFFPAIGGPISISSNTTDISFANAVNLGSVGAGLSLVSASSDVTNFRLINPSFQNTYVADSGTTLSVNFPSFFIYTANFGLSYGFSMRYFVASFDATYNGTNNVAQITRTANVMTIIVRGDVVPIAIDFDVDQVTTLIISFPERYTDALMPLPSVQFWPVFLNLSNTYVLQFPSVGCKPINLNVPANPTMLFVSSTVSPTVNTWSIDPKGGAWRCCLRY